MTVHRGARVEELWVYPLKSAGGIRLDRMELDEFGPMMDRRWILIDGNGRFMSQRTHPRMALLNVEWDGEGVTVHEPGGASCRLPVVDAGSRVDMVVWDRPGHVLEIEGEPGRWMSEWFGERVRVGFLILPSNIALRSTMVKAKRLL